MSLIFLLGTCLKQFLINLIINNMGEYKFSVYAKWQLGFSIEYNGQIIVRLPFMDIHFSLSKYAKGIEIFGRYWS